MHGVFKNPWKTIPQSYLSRIPRSGLGKSPPKTRVLAPVIHWWALVLRAIIGKVSTVFITKGEWLNERIIMSASVRRRALHVVIAIVTVAATLVGATITSSTSSAVGTSTYWNYADSTYMRGYVATYATFSCPKTPSFPASLPVPTSILLQTKHICYWNSPSVYAQKAFGTANVVQAQASMSASFGYVTGSLTASTSAVGVSVTASTKTCSTSTFSSAYNRDYVSAQYNGTACAAMSAVSVWAKGGSATGQLLVNGIFWTAKSISYSV